MAGSGSRALRGVLAAAWRSIIGCSDCRYPGAANSRGCAGESRQQDRCDVYRRHDVHRDRRSLPRRACRPARGIHFWMCVCVFVASYFRGFRAYAAVLSGYTVGIITVVNIDTPQKVFTTMTDRVAAITIGILCVTLINDLFGSPPVWPGLERRITEIWHDVRDYARGVLGGARTMRKERGCSSQQIVGLRDEVDIVAHDMADGRHRAGWRAERDAGTGRDCPTGSIVELA